jgi:hypothetical protein
MRKLVLVLLMSGCAATVPPASTCSVKVNQSKDLVGTENSNTECACSCPTPSSNLLSFGGMVGGLMNLVASANN